jgi:glycosyltransferase involved in cell wall biosynthesis
MKLSAIVIAKNEEKKITECLDSLSWADEVIVVDTGSTDKTIDIAKKKKARVVLSTKGSFSNWRNKGAREAKGDWLLYVDADERVTPKLKKEILSVINCQSPITAYAIPRRNFILGKEMKHGGWWPDYVKRLFKKEKFKKWEGELHEEPCFQGKLGHLKNPLIHLKHDNLEEMVEKTNEWSEIEARLMHQAGHPPMNILRFLGAMAREFWLRMIKEKAFLDGSKGVIYALYQVFSRFVSYAKLWEMQVQNKK